MEVTVNVNGEQMTREIEPALLTKIEQVVRLVRSKGVGVYFVTQNPRDVPDNVLGQLGRADVLGHAVRVLGVEIVKAAFGLELGHRERARPIGEINHRRRHLAALDVGFGE